MSSNSSGTQAKTGALPKPRPNRVDRLRVRHLRLLERIAQTGSLSAAAQQLNMSQPGATKMLQELEAAFACTLIERGKRGAQLSMAGNHALSRLRIALGALDVAALVAQEQSQLPLVRIGAVAVVASSVLPRMVVALDQAGALPRLAIREGTVDELMEMLLDNELDCVVSNLESRNQSMAGLSIARLWQDRLAIVAAPDHPFVRRCNLQVEPLARARWALSARGAFTRMQFEKWFLEAGVVPPVPHIESPSVHTNLALAGTGCVLTMAASSIVRLYEARGVVCELRLAQPMPSGHLFFMSRGDVVELPELDAVRHALQGLARN